MNFSGVTICGYYKSQSLHGRMTDIEFRRYGKRYNDESVRVGVAQNCVGTNSLQKTTKKITIFDQFRPIEGLRSASS